MSKQPLTPIAMRLFRPNHKRQTPAYKYKRTTAVSKGKHNSVSTSFAYWCVLSLTLTFNAVWLEVIRHVRGAASPGIWLQWVLVGQDIVVCLLAVDWAIQFHCSAFWHSIGTLPVVFTGPPRKIRDKWKTKIIYCCLNNHISLWHKFPIKQKSWKQGPATVL